MAIEVLFVVVLVLGNGALAMAEMALVSARSARLQGLAEGGSRRARAALELTREPARFLSTVQIGITAVGILAGAFGGATIAEELAAVLATVPVLGPHAETASLAVVVVGISYLSLVLGELAPKRIALANPERIACAAAGPMRLLAAATSPLVRVLTLSTEAVVRALRVRGGSGPQVTEEEIRILIEQGVKAGVLERREKDLVEGVLRLGDRPAAVVMTPRRKIVTLDVADPPEEIRRKLATTHAEFPVVRGRLDTVAGVVHAKDLLAQLLGGGRLDLEAAMHEPIYVLESLPALDVLARFQKSHARTALVIDEHGTIQGLITLTDILESIVGSFPGGSQRPGVTRREDGSWLVDGMLAIDELTVATGLRTAGSEAGYHTVGGFVLSHLGRIPRPGEAFDVPGYRVEVVDLDGRRVDKILVTRREP